MNTPREECQPCLLERGHNGDHVFNKFFFPHEVVDLLVDTRKRVEDYGHWQSPHYTPWRSMVLGALDMAIGAARMATR
jgi:hypothetical protein